MRTEAEYQAVVAELEKAQKELEAMRDNPQPSFTLIGAGTVYGDQDMITQIERKFGIKPHLKLVE